MAKIKTKFDSLLKLKKSKIDEVQNEISKLNSQIKEAKEELNKLKEEFSLFEYPKSGNFALITQFKEMQKAFINQISQKEQYLKYLNHQKEILLNKLKEANLEYEKIKYLQAEEIKKEIKKQKYRELKEIDEIALMLHKGEQ